MVAANDRAILALGELRGLLTAFEWANGKTNHSYTFTVEDLPHAADVRAALVLHFGEHMADVMVSELPDWPVVVREALRRWLFQYVDLLKPGAVCALADREYQEETVSGVLDRLVRGLQPRAVWQVQGNPRAFYECAWEDFAIEGASARYLLHLGVSD
jgi:hypothetical protein